MGGLWRGAWRRVTFCGWRWSHPGSPTKVAESAEPFLRPGRSGTGSAERGLRRLGTWRRPNPGPDLALQPPRRPKSTNPFTRAQEEDWRRRNKTVLTYVAAAAVGMVGASYAAVPLYRLYCQVGGGAASWVLSEAGGAEVPRQRALLRVVWKGLKLATRGETGFKKYFPGLTGSGSW